MRKLAPPLSQVQECDGIVARPALSGAGKAACISHAPRGGTELCRVEGRKPGQIDVAKLLVRELTLQVEKENAVFQLRRDLVAKMRRAGELSGVFLDLARLILRRNAPVFVDP